MRAVVVGILWGACLITSACGGPALPMYVPPHRGTCELGAMGFGQGPRSVDELEGLLANVKSRLFPDFDDVAITLTEQDQESGYLAANPQVGTVLEPPRQRRYEVRFDPDLFDDPPSAAATSAILAHELRHVADYLDMETLELAGFGLGYISVDVAAYERQTDRYVVELGCGAGLKRYREWLYARLEGEALEAKKRTYMTPDEIDAFESRG